LPLIKICGVSNIKDAITSAENGVDAIGFVCDPNSARYISPEAFRVIHEVVPRRVKRVGVFNRAWSPEWMRYRKEAISLFDRIQYGDDAVWEQIVGETWDMRRKIRSFLVTRSSDLLLIAAYSGMTQAYLVNVHVDRGGRPRESDEAGWRLARQVHQFGRRPYLAGGLTADNVASAIGCVMPYAVDVNVGVESHPGFKDAAKIRDFVQAVRSCADRTRSLYE
jgi:phosphoribosylanthranilate isomerase